MVGLKTFWITISALFLLAACVPQTKQTECKGNEAFNAALRTCVPIVGGPSSFINVSSFAPVSSITKYKDDASTMVFEVTVSNPYNQSYSIAWERVFNGAVSSMCSNALTCSFSANLLGTVLGEVGTHVLIAKVKDGNGTTVDSHNFEIRIVDLPVPAINTASILPATYAPGPYFPTDPRIQFSFTMKNNNATMQASDNYRTVWTITKNGGTIYTESDSFTSFSPSGTNSAYLGTSPTPYFNPATLGVGSYIVRATVQNDVPGQVIHEQQWSVVIKQPDLTKINNITLPAPGVTITAHNNVAYSDYPTYSWISGSPATQPNFCVVVDDRDGTYPSDGKSVQVRFYQDSVGGDICTKTTLDTPGQQTICLFDANPCAGTGLPFDASLLRFSNANNTAPQTHKVTARVFDEATSLEIDRSNVIPSNGSYPIEWIVNVKPTNTAPALAFGATQPTGCISAGAFTRSNCTVNQGTDFTVSFTTVDDFYSPVSESGEFQWNVDLKYNGTSLVTSDASINTSCSKAFATATTLPAAKTSGYTTNWTCTIAVPHHTSSGPVNPSVGSYQVLLTAQDSGSPVGGLGLSSQSLTWNLVVTETNTPALTLNPQTILAADSNISQGATVYDNSDTLSFATEKETVTFVLKVNDQQADDLRYKISLCTDNSSACITSNVISSPSFINYLRSTQLVKDDPSPLIPALAYTLPEDLLIGLHSSPINVDTTTSRLVYFKVEVEDIPSVPLTTITKDSKIFSLYVRNYNPAPVLSGIATPAIGSTTVVYSGNQFTVDPGTVTDASIPASERNLKYQWQAKIGAGAWTSITGATSRVLRYTPGNTSSNIDLRICLGDGTAANDVAASLNCYGKWTVTPKQYLNNLGATGLGTGSVENELAVWYDNTNTAVNTQVIYTAYADTNKNLYVEKTIKDTAGNIVLSTSTISFPALAAGTVGTLSNLSISGSANSVYIAYLASTNSAPGTLIPRIRRIDKNYSLAAPTHSKTALSHPAPFGFSYGNYALTCVAPASCTTAPGDGIGGTARITFTAPLLAGERISINGVNIDASPTPNTDNLICDSSLCTTVSSTATNLRDKINNNQIAGLQGITATTDGTSGVVELFSQYALDYLDFDGTISLVPGISAGVNGLGKILVTGSRWHLPVINTLSGSDQNNIFVLSGKTDTHMRDSANLALNSNDILTEAGKTALFDAKINQAGELVVARISADISDAGKLSLFRYTNSGTDWVIFDSGSSPSATDAHQKDIMGTFNFEYVKLATNKSSNPYYYVIAKERAADGGEWHIGRYNFELDTTAPTLEYFASTKLLLTDNTQNIISDSLMKFPDIVSIPGLAEARIFFHSVGTGAVPFPRLARWRADDTISCGTCFSLNGALEYQSTARVGISEVAPSLTLGVAGATANENINHMVFTAFSSDIGNDDVFKPQIGIINVDSEAIQSTAVEGTGLFQPPFVLD